MSVLKHCVPSTRQTRVRSLLCMILFTQLVVFFSSLKQKELCLMIFYLKCEKDFHVQFLLRT